MVFKRPKFFLDLGGGDGEQPQATVASPQAEPKPQAKAAPPASPEPVPTGADVPEGATALTTAEAIAAELAAAEALRPAPTMATFAPECLTPGGATPMRRRTGGANLGVFKEMAAGMMRN
ncbi:hypothetical protein [Synechococcus sp. CCY 9618]|uniref:hypothetical protein n=1 Tax=Synechococcus sp. CCY 9618 TaxID=2815602 RepID=UPI001C23EB3C|nr:hypothetical protein [Synechococcus sp. CCY 9618]